MTLKYLVLLFFLFSLHLVFGQNHVISFSLKAVVIDSLNSESIPYVSIHKTRDKKGTLSDFKGEFTLDNVITNDTIIFSSIGYVKTIIVANKNVVYDTIYMNREAQLLDEVIVIANNSILYELVSNARKTEMNTEQIAKSYFELESYQNQTQIELFQGYYNGTFQGYNVSDLEMKNGRFALAPISKRIFASTEGSKAICMHNLMKTNTYFPESPFELNRSKLKKHYSLSLNSKYRDDQQHIVYVISFEPRKKSKTAFKGKVWIDSVSNNILKVKLNISDAEIHPFQSIWPDHTLDTIDIEMTKSFIETKNGMVLNTMDFNYNLRYKSQEDSAISILSKAVLHAYNYEDTFLLPFFNLPKPSLSDYQRIQMLPYDNAFWNCIDEFKIENGESKNSFINEQATIGAYELFSTDTIFEKNFFENPYITWSGNRIRFRVTSEDSAKYQLQQGTIPSQRYHLEVQLFMDINELCDSTQIITRTIFDPYQSYFYFPTTKESQAFINIYFDLMEIERRKLELELSKSTFTPIQLRLIYNEAKMHANQTSDLYFKEVQRGANKVELKKWNEIVIKELNIDNITLFGVEL